MWPRMNTVLTGKTREWWGQWGDTGKGEPLKPYQNHILQEIHGLGQWPTPPRHLEPHPGPNVEINNNACLYISFNLVLVIILFIYRLIKIYFSAHNITRAQVVGGCALCSLTSYTCPCSVFMYSGYIGIKPSTNLGSHPTVLHNILVD